MAAVFVDYSSIQGHVYTLLLEGGHYYVGWSSNVEQRIAQHFSGAGSKWTTLHAPVQVLTCVAGDTKLEDVVTISLMCRHGWEKVRGGTWCLLLLEGPPDAVRRALTNAKTRAEPERPPEAGTCAGAADERASRDHHARPFQARRRNCGMAR